MRQQEIEYWDREANARSSQGVSDNIWKRQGIMRRLFMEEWDGQRVLEIGVGLGTAAAAIQVSILAAWKYVATDVSPKFCKGATKAFRLPTVNTDILDLPVIDGGWNRVIALDSLEHVNPEDRQKGYAEIARVLAPKAKMFINMPLEETKHDLRFDHTFDMTDIMAICNATGMRLMLYEEWAATLPNNKKIRYGWVVMEK